MDIQNLVPVDYSNQRVLLTSQVAEIFGTTPNVIRENFRYAKKQFEEGVHYFKVMGEALRTLKFQLDAAQANGKQNRFSVLANTSPDSPSQANGEQSGISHALPLIPKMASAAILYTEQGCARHCKMLNTKEAWEMFDKLEKHYFNSAPAAPVEESLFPDEEPVKKVRRQPVPELAIVYAVLLSNMLVKIGYTRDLTARMKDLQKETKADVLKWAASAVMTRDEAILLERALKVKFFAHLVSGEFFNCNFDDVKAALVAPDDKFNKLLAIADRIQNPDEKDKLLLQAAAVLA